MDLGPLDDSELGVFKQRMQSAFQKGAEDVLGRIDDRVLPDEDIEKSLSEPGAVAYAARIGGKLVGGAIVVIDGCKGDLHFLYVDTEEQNKGIGKFIWNEIERNHPEVGRWETHTPYFDRRNIHFYINACGFSAVEFYCEHHTDGEKPTSLDFERGTDCMFRFEKILK